MLNQENEMNPGTVAGILQKTGYGFSPLVLIIISALTLIIGIGVGYILFHTKQAEMSSEAVKVLKTFERQAQEHEAYLKYLDKKLEANDKHYKSLSENEKPGFVLTIADSLLMESRHSRTDRPK